MRCRRCGRDLDLNENVCDLCGTPVRKKGMTRADAEAIAARAGAAQMPAARRTVRVTRVAAPARREAYEAAAEEMSFAAERRRRAGDVLYGIIVTFLVLLALASATLCVLLLTRGPDPSLWFASQTSRPTVTQTASLPTPVVTANTAARLPTPETSATPVPTTSPSPSPTATPTPAPTSAQDGEAALEALLLQGIERNYTKEELENCSAYELSILRNGMYAYSGLSFKKAQFKDFFEGCDWYEPNTSDDEKVYKRFNTHQRKNVETILAIEKKKGYR